MIDLLKLKMDPTIDYITIKSAFDKTANSRYDGISILKSSYSYKNFNYKLALTKRKIDKPFDNIYVVGKQYQKLLVSISDKQMDNPRFNEARDYTNPFEKIKKSIFFDRAAVKLANIDAIFYLTSQDYTDPSLKDGVGELSSQFGGQLAQQLMGEFYFCDIAGAPGAWSEYIQFRRPGSIGYGISLNNPDLNWNSNILDMSKFSFTYGEDNTGNLYTQSEFFINYAKDRQPQLFDLIMSDGGFGVGDNREFQETITSRLILCECYIGANLVRNGRHFVCKIFNTNTQFLADLIFLMSILFEDVYIFKPISSRPANSERYLVCRRLMESKRSEVTGILKKIYDGYSDEEYFYSIFDAVPDDYIAWLEYHNKLNIDRQEKHIQMILDYLNGIKVEVPIYNLYKALVLWNIPDELDKKINRRINVRRINQKGYLPRTSSQYFNRINNEGMFKVSIGSEKKIIKKKC